MSFLRSRMLVVVLGMIVLAGLSAAVTVMISSPTWQSALIGASASNSASNSASSTTAPSSAGTGTATARATATPTARATSTPVARRSPTPSSQSTSLGGDVVSVDANAGQFVVSSNGAQVTVIVTDTTTFGGAADSLSALSPGMRVNVRGASQASGGFTATSVYASNDN